VAQFIAGVGASLWQIGQEVQAVQSIDREQRGRTLSVYFGVLSAAVAFGPAAGGVLSDKVDVRAVFAVYAALGVLVLLLGQLVPLRGGARSEPPGVAIPRAAPRAWHLRSLGWQAIEPAFRTTFIILLAGSFAASARQTVTAAFLPLYVVGNMGYSGTDVGLLFGIVGTVNLLMIAPAGLISDTLGRKAAVVPAALLAAIAFALYPLAHDLWSLAVLSGLLGVASGFALGSMTIYTYDIVPAHARGTLQGVRRLAGDGGSILGPALGGVIAAAAGPATVFLAFAPLHLASALLLARVARETVQRRAKATNAN
jgi:MFS family permease